MKLIKSILLLFLVIPFMQGCIFVAGAALGASAIAVVYDHRTIQRTIRDANIASHIYEKIHSNPAFKNASHIEVTTFNGIVLLTGQTLTHTLRRKANDLAKSAPHVRKVYNQITVESPTSTLTRTNDSWITAKIKTQMLAADSLKSSNVKVVTEDGIVYLIGSLSKPQAALAVDIARQVFGVKRVIKILQSEPLHD